MEELTPEEVIKKIEAYRAELAEKNSDPILKARQGMRESHYEDGSFADINRNVGMDDSSYSWIVGSK